MRRGLGRRRGLLSCLPVTESGAPNRSLVCARRAGPVAGHGAGMGAAGEEHQPTIRTHSHVQQGPIYLSPREHAVADGLTLPPAASARDAVWSEAAVSGEPADAQATPPGAGRSDDRRRVGVVLHGLLLRLLLSLLLRAGG